MNIYASYLCNFNCKFCSIRKPESKFIDLHWVEEQLSKHRELCSNINILGGEPSILPVKYQNDLIDICIKYSNEKPYYITNLSSISPILNKCKIIVSYDFKLREKSNEVLNNILELPLEFSLSTVLTNYLIDEIGAKRYLKFINALRNCKRADLDLYYKAKDDPIDFTPDNSRLLKFIERVMDDPKVNLAPYSAMKGYIDSSINNISDYFAFTPDNKYGVRLDYINGPYKEFNSYKEAIKYYNDKINNNIICNNCEFNKTCWYPYSDNICHGNKEMLSLFKNKIEGQ